MDSLDCKLLREIMANGRITWSELAGHLGLSGPATAERVRRLEDQGIIKGYAAILDPEGVGASLGAFIAVTLERPEHRQAFLDKVMQLPEIQECHHLAGDDDYMLKVRCRGTKDLERVISKELKSLPGIMKTRTTILLDTCKETAQVPLFTCEP